MKVRYCLPLLLWALCYQTLCCQTACGHGTPIQVNVVAGQLVASHAPDPDGFPTTSFGEDDTDGIALGSINSSQLGPIVVWNLPGLDIYDMVAQSSLSIEPLSRPARTEPPDGERLVWYWNPATSEVEASPANMHLLGTGAQSRLLEPTPAMSPEPFLLADPLTAQQIGFHNHTLLNYAVADAPSAPAGAYGFFARLISDSYTASEPFLLVFNHGVVDYSRMVEASLAIDLAVGIGGDANGDALVAGDDLLTWQREFNTSVPPGSGADSSGDGVVDEQELALWKQNYGYATMNRTAKTSSVPEPGSLLLYVVALGSCFAKRRKRSRAAH